MASKKKELPVATTPAPKVETPVLPDPKCCCHKGVGSLIFIGVFMACFGFGFLINNPPAGLFGGIGLGCLAIVYYKNKKCCCT